MGSQATAFKGLNCGQARHRPANLCFVSRDFRRQKRRGEKRLPGPPAKLAELRMSQTSQGTEPHGSKRGVPQRRRPQGACLRMFAIRAGAWLDPRVAGGAFRPPAERRRLNTQNTHLPLAVDSAWRPRLVPRWPSCRPRALQPASPRRFPAGPGPQPKHPGRP